MREEFKSEHWRDFQQRYQGTFGWYEKDGGVKHLVQLSRVDSETLSFTDSTGFTFTALPDQGNVFNFLPVEKAAYNIAGGDVVVVMRRPQRMWKRGLCMDNTTITSLVKMQAQVPSFELVAAIFGDKKENRVPAFMKGFSGNLTLDNVISFVNGRVYIYDIQIGTQVKERVVLFNNLFEQEVSDVLRNNNLPMTVDVSK